MLGLKMIWKSLRGSRLRRPPPQSNGATLVEGSEMPQSITGPSHPAQTLGDGFLGDGF